ncbi:DEBR0S6_00342g1_1 [Brettanomyces bruxellensis]|uniref:DEBR0S6_00342g1_1 n=1 Tax=Dekkera bruxellensis TaxID=5007 RepID=A0A7D9D049_DEKBR|nr:DEBR0S6_00342g1_1 [Brettanomyces bruxellensis]
MCLHSATGYGRIEEAGQASKTKQGEKEFKRSVIQKSVVLITEYPITIQLKEKLGIITKSYFEQLDFADKSIIKALYDNASLLYNRHGFEIQDDELYDEAEMSSRTSRDGDTKIIRESDFYSGFNLKDLVTLLTRKLLVIYKSLLLEKRILVFCKDLNVLSNVQYSLLSLIPNLVLNLSDSGTPTLDNLSKNLKTPTSLKSSDRGSMLRFVGMPLQLFSKGGFFQPYLTLQQLDYLSNPSTVSFLVGSSNEIILQHKKDWFDVILYIKTPTSDSTTGTETTVGMNSKNVANTAANATSFFFKEPTVKLEILSKSLKEAVTLTWQDKRFIDYVVSEVTSDNKRMLERLGREGKDSKAKMESEPSTISREKDVSSSRSKTLNNNLSLDSENYSGGDDFIRYQFEDYLIGMLSTIKYNNFLEANRNKQETLKQLNLNQFEDELSHFNVKFIAEYKKTVNYSLFARYTEDELFNFFDPVHVGTELYKHQETEGAGKLLKSIFEKWGGGVEEKKKVSQSPKMDESGSQDKQTTEEKGETPTFSANVNGFWKRVQHQIKGSEKKAEGNEQEK